MPDDYAKIAKDKDVEALIQSMTVDESAPDLIDFAKKHNIIVSHSVTWLAMLRQRHHDFDGLLHSVKNMVSIIKDGHDELKKEHTLTREATDNNTAALTKLHTIAETSLAWIKGFVVIGGLSGLAALIKYMIS